MFACLYEWMQNLAFYMVLVTAALHIVPNQSYRKYIRFFTGLVLILMLTAPLFKILGADFQIGEFYEEEEYRRLSQRFQAYEKAVSEAAGERKKIEVEEIRIGEEME